MFNVGQKVVIIESLKNTSKRHPQVGDIGYLSKLFFYPKGRFLLAEIIFCQYVKDIKLNKFRKERKKFIIDVNMPKSLKYKISKYGINRDYFASGNEICIAPNQHHVGHDGPLFTGKKVLGLDKTITIPIMSPNINNYNILFDIWSKSKSNKVSIPIGQLALYSKKRNRKERLTKTPLVDITCSELSAWFMCVWPTIAATLFYSNLNKTLPSSVKPIRSYVSEIYKHSLSTCLLPKRTKKANNSKDADINTSLLGQSQIAISDFVDSLRHAHAMTTISINKTYEQIIKRYMEYFRDTATTEMVRSSWKLEGMSNICFPNNPSISRQLQHVFYRAVFSDVNISNVITKWSPIVPVHDVSKVISKINDIKREAENNSVALNRLYEMGIM